LTFNFVTLAISYSALPDDGDYTETFWICFYVNFNILLKQLFCASVGNKTLIKQILVFVFCTNECFVLAI